MSHTESFFAVQGNKLRMFRGGQGTPALLLHGAAGLSQWSSFLQKISDHHDLIVPEHPGFGKSDDPASIASIPDLAEFYLDVIRELGLQEFHLIGSSMGGWLASEIAIRNHSRIKSLTLVGPAGLRPKQVGGPKPTPEEETRRIFHDQSIPDRMLAQVFTDEQKAIQQKNKATVAKLGNLTFCNPELESALANVKVPALIVWGENDRIVPVAHAALWQAALPDARVLLVPESGHLPHYEKPGLVGKEVTEFLAATEKSLAA